MAISTPPATAGFGGETQWIANQRQGRKSPTNSYPATNYRRIDPDIPAMLSKPIKGWQVHELAKDDDVQVSPGLVVKVKRRSRWTRGMQSA